MFYWDKDDNSVKLEAQLQSINKVKEIFIASAFLSIDGVAILQKLVEHYNIKKENITICVSEEFSDDRPSEILNALDKIANVRISKGDRLFHPKLYFFKGENDSLLIYGSSNLTGAGFGRNIEFDNICKPSHDETIELENFIQYCFKHTNALTKSHIDFYKSQEEKLSELKKLKIKLQSQLKSYEKRDDPFTEDTYNIADFYFNFADYEVLFSRNSTANNSEISTRRKKLKGKLLEINKAVEQRIKALNLYVHWNKNKITSLDYPSIYNKNVVNWMGIRYGKRKEEVCFGGGVKEEYESFTKHACLQYVLYTNGFEIDLFFAVPDNAFDRQYLKENLNKISADINKQAEKMRGYGLEWRISGCKNFNFDTDDDLAAYLKENDCDGKFSSLNMHFEPDDCRIKSLQDICNEVLKGFELLKPLYDLIAWRGRELKKV